MELLLIRHAIAFERDRHRWHDDRERPLSPRGAARARKAAAGLERLVKRPAQVFTSPLVRAQQTAALLAETAGWPTPTDCAQLAPGSPADEFLAFLLRSSVPRIAAVGHEPDLSELLAVCLRGSAPHASFTFRKMGVAQVMFHGAPRAGRGRLVQFLTPRTLRAAR